MTSAIGTFRVGEDIAVALDVTTGDVADIATVTASMVKYGVAGFTPISMTVTPRAASGAVAAGWNISLTGAQTTGLAAGNYVIDAKLVGVAGSIDITDQSAFIKLTQGAIS